MKKMLFIFPFFYCVQLNAQNQDRAFLDSLLNEVQKTNVDTLKVKLYAKIAYWYLTVDMNKSLLYTDTASAISRKVNWKQGIASSDINYGNVYNFKGDYSKAIGYYKKANEIYKELKFKKGMASTVYSLGTAYENLSNYPVAANYYFDALHINESIPDNDLMVANCLGGIATVYFLQKDYIKSLKYSLQTVKKQQSANNQTGVVNEFINIADTYYKLSDSANALKYNLKALELSKKLNLRFQEGIVYSQLGVLNNNNSSISLEYLVTAQKILEEISPNFASTILNRGEIGKAFLRIIKDNKEMPVLADTRSTLPKTKSDILQKAESYLQSAIISSKETGDKDKESSFSADLAEVQALKGNFKGAYLNFKNFHTLNDSLYSQENKNKIAALESQKTVDLKDKEIQINKLAISDQRKTQVGLVAGLCLLGTIGGLLFWQNRTRKKTNTTLLKLNSELDEANKIKATFFGILSHDLRGPIANLVNFLHLQKESPDLFTPEQANANQKKISSSADNLLETMEAMLLWSKGQMQHFKPQIKMVAVSSLFEHLQQFFSSTENVLIGYSQPPGLMVSTDENYLQTIMHNLTSNAIKVLQNTPNATIHWLAKQEGNQILLSVTDNGPGVKAEQVKALNEDNAVVNSKTGFGLHIIRDLAKAIQCRISLQPGDEAGTTFVLSV
jgi:signal transduction histidine kinase/tetratricopeptide (TPR) repeat protein